MRRDECQMKRLDYFKQAKIEMIKITTESLAYKHEKVHGLLSPKNRRDSLMKKQKQKHL